MLARKLAKIAIDIGAVSFNTEDPYTWASGYRMPLYNDNRKLLSRADIRKLVCDSFIQVIKENNIEANLIAGTATAGIPHATTLADNLELPLIYVRSKPKGHGLKNLIEGAVPENSKALVVEDVVSTGGSSVKAVNAVRESGAEVLACLTIFNYGFPAAVELFQESHCQIFSLFTFETLLEVAIEEGTLSEEQSTELQAWRADPFSWGVSRGFPKEN